LWISDNLLVYKIVINKLIHNNPKFNHCFHLNNPHAYEQTVHNNNLIKQGHSNLFHIITAPTTITTDYIYLYTNNNKENL
jgi:hypothetical protein